MAQKFLDYDGVQKLWGKIKDKDSSTLASANAYTDKQFNNLVDSIVNSDDGGIQIPYAEKASLDEEGNTIHETYIKIDEKAVVNGIATLDGNGKVPSSQLPSYVDDVLEYENVNSFPTKGEVGKIYVALDTNKIYRYSGTQYTVISETLSLGTTANTAYSGASGKANADAIELLNSFNNVAFATSNSGEHVAYLALEICKKSDITSRLNYDTLKSACDKANKAVVGNVVGNSGETTSVTTEVNKFNVTIKDSVPTIRGNLEINENDAILGSNNDIWIGYIKNGSTISTYNESVNLYGSDHVKIIGGSNSVTVESTNITMGSSSDPTDLTVNGQLYVNGYVAYTEDNMVAITTSELEDILK